MDLSFPEHWVLLGALSLSAGLIALLIKPARALGWVDVPSTRKHHREPVPLVGGIAMCAAFCLSVPLLPAQPRNYPVLLAGMALLTLVGLYDDLRSTRPATRFLLQAGVILLMALVSDGILNHLGDLFGTGAIKLEGFAVLFTLFGVIGVINALNMIDGLDGLAGGMALVASGWLIVLCLNARVPDPGDIGALLVLVMVIAGFLAYNLRHPWRAFATVFMGDSGSTMLGFVLSWFVVHLSQGNQAAMAPMTAVWILALPLMDTVAVMIRRIRAGQSPFAADRQHLHHLLLGRGLSDGRVTAIMLVIASLSGAVGVFAWWLGVPEYVQFYVFLGIFLLYYRTTTGIWMEGKTIVLSAGPLSDRRHDPLRANPDPSLLHPAPRQNPK
ncbi:MAG: MraY family glycosyltransferase [Candidatus Competibacter sp.]|nr:MraY family glycosyltransferase [Candidatus Competibacter sp.]